jgi:nucleoside 2-deoxyribosyltransferase
MRGKTIYIAGPMRGKPNWNYEEFNRAEGMMSKLGWEVINPATLDTNSRETQDLDCSSVNFDPDTNSVHREVNRKIMKRDLDAICDSCDAIYMLEGWQMSQGACAEFYLACALGITILYENTIDRIISEELQ